MDALPCCRFPPLIFEVIKPSCTEPFAEPLIEDPPLDDEEGEEESDVEGV